MSYKAIIEARQKAEEGIESIREGVRLGLEMRKESDARKAAIHEESNRAERPVSEDKDVLIGRLVRERDNALAMIGAAYAAGYVQAEAGLPNHADRHEAAATALRGIRKEAYEDAANAVEDYCSDMPDLAGHGHSTGLRDAIILRAEESLAPESRETDTETPSL